LAGASGPEAPHNQERTGPDRAGKEGAAVFHKNCGREINLRALQEWRRGLIYQALEGAMNCAPTKNLINQARYMKKAGHRLRVPNGLSYLRRDLNLLYPGNNP
jgi:hypothetical protein